MTKIVLEDNGKKGRFVLFEDEQQAGEIIFTWAGTNKFIIEHTEVDSRFGGKGYGKKLVLEAIDFARKNKHHIIPLCPYAKTVFERNENLQDVL
ncbi:MAG TPA: GNAT family N-acetyltransferase [Chitinophagaceae bacterium]|nr:N-acetyltransferase [Chitinophagaceae bacterium]HQU56321.1 GNAT family N-acetyltransferase [Chitinophagaceae bacterium]